MKRFLAFVTCVSLGLSLRADDQPKKLKEEERKELEMKWTELNRTGLKAHQAGNNQDAQKAWEPALEIARRLYPKTDFPDGHLRLAASLNNMAGVWLDYGKLDEAELLYREALDVRRRLFKGNHTELAAGIHNLAGLLRTQGKLAEAEVLFRESLAMYEQLFMGDHPMKALSLVSLGRVIESQGKLSDAERLIRDALSMRQRLFKGNHPDLAQSLNNLATVLKRQGKLSEAEPLFRAALAMYQSIHKEDHTYVAICMNNLGMLLMNQGKLTEAEPFIRDALAMYNRLYKTDHPYLAEGMDNLAMLLQEQEKTEDAEKLYRDALSMRQRLYKGDHPRVAASLDHLGILLRERGKLAEAEKLLGEALKMRQLLFPGDHPDVAESLNSLAILNLEKGKPIDAETLCRASLSMRQRLYQGDHPGTIACLTNLAGFLNAQGKFADAELLYRQAVSMSHRLTDTFAREKAEGEALTFIASLPYLLDSFLSNERLLKADPAAVYPVVWAEKGALSRIYEQRQQQVRLTAIDPKAGELVAELADARHRRAELLFAPEATDQSTHKKREEDIKAVEKRIADLEQTIRKQWPDSERVNKIARANPSDLQKALPADAAVVDFLRYIDFEFDKNKPGLLGRKRNPNYLVFVVTRDKISWVDLGSAERIEMAITDWRKAITDNKESPGSTSAKVRELVWEKVRKELPASIKNVYICPDEALCGVPWPALPGDKPGTILLEDYAFATITFAPFLLDKLGPQVPAKTLLCGALIIGGVKYEAELPTQTDGAVARPGDPLLKPATKLAWSLLPGTVAEARGVTAAAELRRISTTHLSGDKATASAVLAALPKAKYVHMATHGFFADASFRSVFQLDEKDYVKARWGERVGRAANNPLMMTGLVFAGANNPKTPGRGIITGESLIDLDLSGLELAVLSACETGLGDVAGGEGTFGLQRAFHMGGTRNVIASLWKVPDQSTVALMALFYRNLWEKNLSPMESLRQAQLEIHRNPGKIADLAKGFRGKFEEVSGTGGELAIKPGKDGTAHPLLWAAFTLSGPGR
jgi:CHAT domain-containing protein/Tfp pilus assembly protein PilF